MLTQKYSRDPQALLQRLFLIFSTLSPDHTRNLLLPLFVYVFELVDIQENKLVDLISDLPPIIKTDIMSTYDRIVKNSFEKGIKEGIEKGIEEGIEKGIEKGIEQGIEQGIEKGIEKGVKQKQKEVILKAFHSGISLNLISNIVGVTLDEVKSVLVQNGMNITE